MEILGNQLIPATQQEVWDALNNPEILKKCLPGCQSVERINPDLYKVIITAAIGPLKAKFNGTLHVTEANVPHSCTLIFEGQGGAVGFGKGSSSVELRVTEGGTELSYSAQAHVGGKLAQIGSRLIDNVAKKMSDDFFKAFHAEVSNLNPNSDTSSSSPKTNEGTLTTESFFNPIANGASPLKATSLPVQASEKMVPAWWLIVATIVGAGIVILRDYLLK